MTNNSAVSKSVYRPGLNLSPYVLEGQDPNLQSQITKTHLRELIRTIQPYTDWVRFFGMSNGLENGCEVAHDFGLKAAVGIWLDRDHDRNENQISTALNISKIYKPEMVIVGSETLFRKDLTEHQLLQYIDQVRESFPSGTIITTADSHHILIEHPKVLDSVDVIMANIYPYFSGEDIEKAILILNIQYEQLIGLAKGNQVIISETGWPSFGEKRNHAIASPENAALYFLQFASWAQEKKVTHFYFEAFDEPWKARYEGLQGSHFGLWDKNKVLKPGMQEVFEGKRVENILEISSIAYHQKKAIENLPWFLKTVAQKFAK